MRTHSNQSTTLSALRLMALSMLFLSGCASQKIGPASVYLSPQDKTDPPLKISASYRSDLCSPGIGYIAVAIKNPRDEWKKLSEVQLGYPYTTDGFHALKGEEILAWADAQSQRTERDRYNENMARLAALTVSAVMVSNNNKPVNKAGEMLIAGEAISAADDAIKDAKANAEMPQGKQSNHLFSDELLIPPHMDRTFWILVGADSSAPFMGYASMMYNDENSQSHQLLMNLAGWQECDWQQNRQQFLLQWAEEQGLKVLKSKPVRNGGAPKQMPVDWVELEKSYQQWKRSQESQPG